MPEKIILELEDLLEFASLGIELAWDPSPHPPSLCLPFGIGMSILGVLHHHTLEAHNLRGSVCSQLERKLTSG